jgi:hypothetical protein
MFHTELVTPSMFNMLLKRWQLAVMRSPSYAPVTAAI